jgi:DNA primase
MLDPIYRRYKLKRHLDISGWLVHHFKAELRNDNWRLDCPICGADKQRFSVSIPKGVVHCWKCNYTNSLLGLVSEVESVGVGAAFRIVQKYKPITVTKPFKKVPRDEIEVPQESPRIISGYRLLPIQPQTFYERLAINYLRKRGVPDNVRRDRGLGISSDEKYSGRIIIPFNEFGRVVYFVARSFHGGGPKYLNPSLAEWNVGKAELLYNLEWASTFEDISIVEGVFDSISVGRHSVAILGKVASDRQLARILSLNPSSINVMLDADAKKEAVELASQFGDIIPTKITFFKSGDPAENDGATTGKEEVQYSLRTLVRSKLSKP